MANVAPAVTFSKFCFFHTKNPERLLFFHGSDFFIKKTALCVLLLSFCFYGCVKEVENTNNSECQLYEAVFHAGWDPETKTVLQEDGSVWWSPGDEIILYTGPNDGYKLTSNNTDPAANVDFVGEIGNGSVFTAIYPYNARNSYDGEFFCLDFSDNQQDAIEGSFEKKSFVSIAQSSDYTLFFRNVCGGIKFSVVNEGITRIRFDAKSTIGGYLLYRFDEEGVPVYSGCQGAARNSRIIDAPNRGTFEPGKDYYIVFPSMSIPDGITIKVYKGKYSDEWSYTKPIEIHRSRFKYIEGIDKNLRFPQDHSEKSALLYEFLPEDIHKESITGVEFNVKSNIITDKQLSASSPVYYDISGGTVNLYTTEDYFDISQVTSSMFYQYSALKHLDLSNTLVNTATSFREMFRGCLSLESIQFGDWDTFFVTDMALMFSGCRELCSVDLSFMDTHNVTNMFALFNECWCLSSLDLKSFETSKVTEMQSMFSGCKGLRSLDISSFNTSCVTTMEWMFADCEMLRELNLSNFDTRSVTDMLGMFSNSSIEELNISSFNTTNVVNMAHMFAQCLNLKSLDISNFQTSNCQNMDYMFLRCDFLKELNISSFSSESLQSAEGMFEGCERLEKLNLGEFDISQATCPNIGRALMRITKAGAIRCTPVTKAVLEQNIDDNLESTVVWLGISDDISTYEYPRDPNLYYSSDFSKHETVKKLYSATKGQGINIVLMGDAYSDRMIASGLYDADMELAVDAIFEKEPFASFKEYFNIYIVYLVSDNEVLGESTALHGVSSGSGILSGYISANLPSSYVIQATGNGDLSYSTEIVIVRGSEGVTGYAAYQSVGADGEANDTHYYDCDYGYGYGSICVSRGNPAESELYKITIGHEIGHAFSMLMDEYVTIEGTIMDTYSITEMYDRFGWAQNLDVTSDPNTIRWSQFLADDRYVEDGIGIFEGGASYSTGVWRPSENSIMNSGTEFNAPSRAAIYKKIHKLAYGRDWQFDYEDFVQWDTKNIGLESRSLQSNANELHPHLNRKPFVHMQKRTNNDGREEISVIMN